MFQKYIGESWGNLGYPGDNKIWPKFFRGTGAAWGCVGLRGAHRVIQNSGAERGGGVIQNVEEMVSLL